MSKKIENKADPDVIRWLEKFSQELDDDPDIIDIKPIEKVREELGSAGADNKNFHKRYAEIVGITGSEKVSGSSSERKTMFVSGWKKLAAGFADLFDFSIIFFKYKPVTSFLIAGVCLFSLFLSYQYLQNTYFPGSESALLTKNGHSKTGELEALVTESYELFYAHLNTMNHQQLEDQIKIPRDTPERIYGFTPSDQKNPALLSLNFGMLMSRQEMLQKLSFMDISEEIPIEKKAELSKFVTYYRMGQWTFLLQVACLSDIDIPKSFWDQQKEVVEKMLTVFSENKSIISDLEQIRSILENVEKPGRIQRRIMVDRLNSILGFLS